MPDKVTPYQVAKKFLAGEDRKALANWWCNSKAIGDADQICRCGEIDDVLREGLLALQRRAERKK